MIKLDFYSAGASGNNSGADVHSAGISAGGEAGAFNNSGNVLVRNQDSLFVNFGAFTNNENGSANVLDKAGFYNAGAFPGRRAERISMQRRYRIEP